MAKYKPADALKIKQEIASLQEQRALLVSEIEGLQEEKESVRQGIAIWRGVFTRVGESIVSKVQAGAVELEELTQQKESVITELSEGQKILSALKASIGEAKRHVPEDTTGFARSVLLSLTRKIGELTSRKGLVEADLADLEAQQRSLDISLKKLTQDKLEAIEEIRRLMAGIAEGARKYSDVMADIGRCEDTLKAIERREQDSRILMNRLSDQYRETYMKRHGALDS